MHSMKVKRKGNLVYSFEQTNPQVAIGYATDGKYLVKGTAKFSNDFIVGPEELNKVFYRGAIDVLNRRYPEQTRFRFVKTPTTYAMMNPDPQEMVTIEEITIDVEWTIKLLEPQHPHDIVPATMRPFFYEYEDLEVEIEEDSKYMQFKIVVRVDGEEESAVFTAEYLEQKGGFPHAIEFLVHKADGKQVFHTGGPVTSGGGGGAAETMKLLGELFDLSQKVPYCKKHGVLCSCKNRGTVSLKNAAIGMNDGLGKTRNEIADALEALDIDLEIKSDAKAAQTIGG